MGWFHTWLVNRLLMFNCYLKWLPLYSASLYPWFNLACHLFPMYLLITTCAHPCYNHTAQRRKLLEVCWRCYWVLGVRKPRSIACKVWSLHFPLKLCIIVSLFYLILLFIIPLWHRYMYGTWSWHTYSYAFGFVLKIGCLGLLTCIARTHEWLIGSLGLLTCIARTHALLWTPNRVINNTLTCSCTW